MVRPNWSVGRTIQILKMEAVIERCSAPIGTTTVGQQQTRKWKNFLYFVENILELASIFFASFASDPDLPSNRFIFWSSVVSFSMSRSVFLRKLI
jgi:hypothetical protein